MLCWIDLETTGLDPGNDFILEVGIILTDHKLNHLSSYSWLINYHSDPLVMQFLLDLNEGNLGPEYQIVHEMHTKNHLLEEVICNSTLPTLEEAEEGIFNFIDDFANEYCQGEGIHPAGSSVHFDIDFLRHYMPKVTELFHHRHYDVSSIKMYFESRSGVYDKGPEDEHRALSDLANDINWIRAKLEDN